MPVKPFSQSCENNKAPILLCLQDVFSGVSSVLEIGSGTGQHAVYFAQNLPHLKWQSTDREENLAGIREWIGESDCPNLLPVKSFDVCDDLWPAVTDAVFSANTAHIMPWEITTLMIEKVGRNLPVNGVFALYGPFNYQGEYTCASNEKFDGWLKSVNPTQGIRHFERVVEVAKGVGLTLNHDYEMPANNRLLVWRKER